MKKRCIYFVIALIALFTTLNAKELLFLHTNDHHGSLETYENEGYLVPGLAERSTIIKVLKADNENVLLLDAGDLNHGQYLSNIFHAEPDILIYNHIGYDAMALGNHEFYGDIPRLLKQRNLVEFEMLSANTSDYNNNGFVSNYMIKRMPNGLNIAIIGFTVSGYEMDGIKFQDEVAVANRIIPDLKKRTDIIIALVHLGSLAQFPTGAIRLAKEVKGIDLIIDGHSHTVMNEALIINNTPIVQAGDRGKYIGKGILDYNENTKQITLKSWESIELMKPEAEFNYEKDPVVVDIINKFAVEIENEIELIANIPESFTSSHLRLELTPLGKLVNDAVLKEVIDKKPHLSIINSGAIRASLIKGIVKNTDVYTMFPFEDKVICIDLTGEEILDIINASYSENRGSGAFLQYSSNIQIIINDDEIKEVFITTPLIPDNESGKMPIVKEKTYTIATLDYLYDEGDGYHQFKNGKNLIRTDIDMDEAIINYLKEKYPIK